MTLYRARESIASERQYRAAVPHLIFGDMRFHQLKSAGRMAKRISHLFGAKEEVFHVTLAIGIDRKQMFKWPADLFGQAQKVGLDVVDRIPNLAKSNALSIAIGQGHSKAEFQQVEISDFAGEEIGKDLLGRFLFGRGGKKTDDAKAARRDHAMQRLHECPKIIGIIEQLESAIAH